MDFSFVRTLVVLGFAHLVLCQQLFASEPSCAQSCYSSAVSIGGCSPTDLSCQCAPAEGAAIALAGGPCFLASCGVSDLAQFSSALSTACASATSSPTGPATSKATLSAGAKVPVGDSSSSSSSSSPSGLQALSGPARTGEAGQIDASLGIDSTYTSLTAGAITGIAFAGLVVGCLGCAAFYFFAVVRKRKLEERAWESEKREMQSSLNELRRQVVSSHGSFESASSLEKAGVEVEMVEEKVVVPAAEEKIMAEEDTEERTKVGYGGRQKSVLINGKDGPVELMVPEQVYFELPSSPFKPGKT